MNNLKQAPLNKNRSYTACVSAAHKMFFDNIKTIFRHTWAYAMAYALSIALFLLFSANYQVDRLSASTLAGIFISLMIMVCAQIAYFARTMMLVDNQPMKWNVIRCVKIVLWYTLLTVIIATATIILIYIIIKGRPVYNPDTLVALFMTLASAAVIAACFTLPYIYVVTKYFMESDSKFRKLIFKSYKTGIRHWGFIFTTILITALCVAVCAFFVSIPALVIMTANMQSAAGVSQLGDPVGLPSYFSALEFIVISLSSFISAYINIFVVFVYYFMYGSIETREKEKSNFLNNSHETAENTVG